MLCCSKATVLLFLVLGGAHGAYALRKARDFARCGFAMEHTFLRGTHDDRLGFLQGRPSSLLLTGGNRLLELVMDRARLVHHTSTRALLVSGKRLRASRDEGSGAVGLALHSRPCRSMPATSTNTIRIETHQIKNLDFVTF